MSWEERLFFRLTVVNDGLKISVRIKVEMVQLRFFFFYCFLNSLIHFFHRPLHSHWAGCQREKQLNNKGNCTSTLSPDREVSLFYLELLFAEPRECTCLITDAKDLLIITGLRSGHHNWTQLEALFALSGALHNYWTAWPQINAICQLAAAAQYHFINHFYHPAPNQ